MDPAVVLQQLAVRLDSCRNSASENCLPEETIQRPLAMEGRLLTGKAEGEVQR